MHILDWKDPKSWFPRAVSAMRAYRDQHQLTRLPRDEALECLISVIANEFTYVRVYHACRPVDVSSYYERGIIRHNDWLLDRAREFFRSFPEIPSDAVERAIVMTDLTSDHGRVFVVLDDRIFLTEAGQYLIYGSEAIMSIAATLIQMGYPDYQPVLRGIGRPTVFVCEVPVQLIDNARRIEIAEALYDAYRAHRGSLPAQSSKIDHTVVLYEDIPKAAVVSHYHPVEIVDWHNHGQPYRW